MSNGIIMKKSQLVEIKQITNVQCIKLHKKFEIYKNINITQKIGQTFKNDVKKLQPLFMNKRL